MRRDKTGRLVLMVLKNLTFKSLTSGKVPESCRAGGNICLEALTGLCECRVLSPKRILDVRALRRRDGQHSCSRYGETVWNPVGSEALCEHTSNNLRENRDIPWLARSVQTDRVRIVNPGGVRR